MVNELKFISLQDAWEGVNEFMVSNPDKIISQGGGIYGTEFISYDNRICTNNCFIDPNFDFGAVLGYSPKKWTTLIKNYVDFSYLDLLKSEITYRRNKKAKSYNYAFRFSNKYGGGKDCLIALVFSKKVTEEFPTVNFSVRVSEVTSRLIFDFLLIQRICEYVYGKGYPVEVKFDAPSMYVTAERFTMYAEYAGWERIEKLLNHPTDKFQQRIKSVWNHFSTMENPNTIKYKSHRRCALTMRKDEDGHSLKRVPSLKAKDLPLTKLITQLPADIVTDKEIKQYLKTLTK